MRISDFLIFFSALAVGGAIAFGVGGGKLGGAVMAIAVGGTGAFVGGRVRDRRKP